MAMSAITRGYIPSLVGWCEQWGHSYVPTFVPNGGKGPKHACHVVMVGTCSALGCKGAAETVEIWGGATTCCSFEICHWTVKWPGRTSTWFCYVLSVRVGTACREQYASYMFIQNHIVLYNITMFWPQDTWCGKASKEKATTDLPRGLPSLFVDLFCAIVYKDFTKRPVVVTKVKFWSL